LKPWKSDKEWADQFWPEIEEILRDCAGHIIDVTTAAPLADRQEATDYVIELTGGKVGCRIRRCEYYRRFADFTLRSSRPSGQKTEIEKLREGWGDWYLYGWECDGSLIDWKLIDLDVFRQTLIERPNGRRSNTDHSSDFWYWTFDSLREAGCVVAEAQTA